MNNTVNKLIGKYDFDFLEISECRGIIFVILNE